MMDLTKLLTMLRTKEIAIVWAKPLAAAMASYGIVTNRRKCMFLAQVLFESGGLIHLEENLHYRPEVLMGIWGSHFKDVDDAKALAQEGPQAIANRVYACRMGNGDEASGDGWKYRGRGLIQITGHDNYAACGKALGLALTDLPDALLDPVNAALSAGWFWLVNGCNEIADKNDFAGTTHKINGGLTGQPARESQLKQVIVAYSKCNV